MATRGFEAWAKFREHVCDDRSGSPMFIRRVTSEWVCAYCGGEITVELAEEGDGAEKAGQAEANVL